MIFNLFCITLIVGVSGLPAEAAGADNHPDAVRRAIERASDDRRFKYPEGSMESLIDEEALLKKLAEWEKQLHREKEDEQPGPVAGSGTTRGSRTGGWGWGDISFDPSTLTYVLYALAVCVVAFIIYWLILYYNPRLRAGYREDGMGGGAAFEDLNPVGQLALAQELMRQGRWREALSALMMSLLLALDAKQLIRYHRSRTNREYLVHLGKHPILLAVAREFVHNFEEMRYGHRIPDRDGVTYMLDLYRQAENALPRIAPEGISEGS